MENKDEFYESEKNRISMNKKEEKKKSHHKKNNLNESDKIKISDIDSKSEEESKNKCLRCLNCFSIPLLNLNNIAHMVKINCNQGHNISIDVQEFIEKGYMNNFNNQICSQCKSKIDVLTERKNYYCKECNELFCRSCIKNHNLIFNNSNENQNSVHHFINLEKFDTTCILHNETYGYFCLDCNQNICQFCNTSKHKMHKVLDLDDINLKRKEIKKIKDYFIMEKENLNLAFSLFKKIIIKIKREIKKIFEYKEAELKFKEDVIKIYERTIDNYNVIRNIKSLLFYNSPFIIDNKRTCIEQLNYFYEYINQDLEKLNQKKINFKESNSSISSRFTNKNISDNEVKNLNKNNNNLNKDIPNKASNDNKIEDSNKKVQENSKYKVKSHDKINHKIKIKKVEKKENENRQHKKRRTVQLTNIDLLIKNNFNKLTVNKSHNTSKSNNITEPNNGNDKNILFQSDDLSNNNTKSIEVKDISINNEKSLNKAERIEVNKIKPKKGKVKKIIKKIKKKIVKKDNNSVNAINTSESESNTENNIINLKDKILGHRSKKYSCDKIENGKRKIEIKPKELYVKKEIEDEPIKSINLQKSNNEYNISSSIANNTINDNKKEEEKDLKETTSIKTENDSQIMSPEKKEVKEENKSKNTIENSDIKDEKSNSNVKDNEKSNSNVKDNDPQNLLMKKLKIPRPPIDNRKKEDINLDLIESHRHKKIVNPNNSRNISVNFQINHSVVEFYSYGGNLNGSLRENKKRIQILYKMPSEMRKNKLLNNSFTGSNNNSFSLLNNNDQIKKTNNIKHTIYKDLTNEFNSEKTENKDDKDTENKENKDTENKDKDAENKENKDDKNNKENKENKGSKDDKENKDNKDSKNDKENKDNQDDKEIKDNKENKENKENNGDKGNKENNDDKGNIDNKDDKDKKDKSNEEKDSEELTPKKNALSEKHINKINQAIKNIYINNINECNSNSNKFLNSIEATPIKDNEFFLSDGKTLNDFKTKSLRLTIKEYENSVYSLLGINSSIFAIGFLNGEIDIYDTNDINCLFSIVEHNSRINNLSLLKEPNTILSSSFDYTMKKIKILPEKKTYVIEFIFDGYNNIIYKGIELSNDHIISISFGGEISIWNKMTNKAYLRGKKTIIENEELYDIIEINNKLIAISTDESLHFFSINNNKNEFLIQNKKITDLEFKQRNNMVMINNNILGLLLKNEIGLVNVIHKQIMSKINIYEGKPETITLLKNKTILISACNYNFKDYDEETEDKNGKNSTNKNKIIFMQYELVNNGLMFLLKKEEDSDKINSKDYCRITAVSEFSNGIIVFSTSGMEDNKICGSISAFDY